MPHSRLREGFTFNDVLLAPRRSSIASRSEADPSGLFSRGIRLKTPIVSANMDTVTESVLAIAMARLGGLGVIHRFLSIEEQVSEVRHVKRAESVVIEEPYTLFPEQTVAEARELMERQEVGGLLVVDLRKRLLGVLTTRDIQFGARADQAVKEVMTKKVITAPPQTTSEEAERLLHENRIEKLPLVDKAGRLTGLITAKDIVKKRRAPQASKDKKGRLLVGAAVGVVGSFLERSAALIAAGADVLVVDVAHGHADHVLAAVKAIKKRWPAAEVVAGNVATYAGARDLAEAGADGVKVGVGPGGACTTRIVAGAGVPQLSAVLDCARLTRQRGVPICADGGIRDSGDIVKALAGGASCVMIGSLLAGTDESPGWTVVRKGMKYKAYRGMASLGAALSRQVKEKGQNAPFSDEEVAEVVPEGVETMVPYRGSAAEVVHQLAGGLRSGMSYCGSRTLPELWKNAEFIRITPAAWLESKPHAAE